VRQAVGLSHNTEVRLQAGKVRIRPATLDDASALGRLWWQAFPDKFGPAFGPDGERNAALLADLHRAGSGRMIRATLVAEADGQIIGFLLFHPGRKGLGEFPLAEGWRAFRRYLGVWGALRAVLILALLEVGHPRFPPDHTVVEMVGVDPVWRGRGVGRALMEAAIEQAKASGAKGVALDIVWGNDPARRLYERLGFAPVAEKRSRLLARLTGHSGWARMVLPLGDDG